MPADNRRPKGLTKNEVIVLSVLLGGLLIYTTYMFFVLKRPSEAPVKPKRKVVLNQRANTGRTAAPLPPSVKNNADRWLNEEGREIAEKESDEIVTVKPDIFEYKTDDVYVPFRILVRSEQKPPQPQPKDGKTKEAAKETPELTF